MGPEVGQPARDAEGAHAGAGPLAALAEQPRACPVRDQSNYTATPQACPDLVSAENEPSKVFVTPALQNYNTWSLYSQPSKAVTALAWQPLHLADSPMCAAP